MARGKKTPTKIKKLQGTINVTRDSMEEIAYRPVDGIPKPPDYFGPIARREWFELLPQLKDAGVLEQVDLPQLRIYCHCVQEYEEATHRLRDDGSVNTAFNAKTGTSYEVPSPWIKIKNDAINNIARIASKFGFDPVARMKVAAPKKQEEKQNPFEAALDGTLKVAK